MLTTTDNSFEAEYDEMIIINESSGYFNDTIPFINPLEMDNFTLTIHCICCTIGLPLNIFIALKIIRNSRLYSKPRYIFLLTLVMCNIFTLLTAVDEVVYYLWPNESVCKFFISINELPYILFFFNLLLSLINRYIAMARPMWHHQNVTVAFVLFWIIVLNLTLALAINWVYISGSAELRCEIQRTHANTLDSTLLVLCISCITLKIVDYVKTRKSLPRHNNCRHPQQNSNNNLQTSSIVVRAISHSRSNGAPVGQHIEMVHIVTPQQQQQTSPQNTTEERLNIHIGSAALSRMEKEATRTCVFGVLRLLLLPCPLLAFTFSHLICTQLIYPEGNEHQQCQNILKWAPYFKELITFHAVVHPSVFLLRSNDFFSDDSINADELYG